MHTNFDSFEHLSRELDEFEEAARVEDAKHKKWHHAYVANPDCRDPSHPGCPKCWEQPFALPDSDIESDCV